MKTPLGEEEPHLMLLFNVNLRQLDWKHQQQVRKNRQSILIKVFGTLQKHNNPILAVQFLVHCSPQNKIVYNISSPFLSMI